MLQVYEPVMHGLHLPEWTLSFVVVALAFGFPITAVLSWVFDLKSTGIERTTPAAEGSPPTTVPRYRGLRLALVLLGLGAAAAAPGLVYFFVWPGSPSRRADVATGVPGPPSIAVLPFVNLSSDKEQDYFSDGVAEEILNALAQVQGLRVIGRTSSFSMKGKNEDLRTIAQRLNVANLLEGSVRKSGQRVRITAQLIEAVEGSHLWSQEFDGDLSDTFAVQEKIAKAVTSALRLKLLPSRTDQRVVNGEVYDLFLKGTQALREGTPEAYQRAIGSFERATVLDKDFAPAWAGLAEARIWLLGVSEEQLPQELGARASAAADRAIALAPDLADGYRVRGVIRRDLNRDWAGARADLERAVALGPGDPEAAAQLSYLLSGLGEIRESAAQARRATSIDPLSSTAWYVLADVLDIAGDLEGGRDAAARALALSQDNPIASIVFVGNRILAGQPDAALAQASRSKSGWVRLTGTALAAYDLGRTAEANSALEELITRFGQVAAYQVAEVFAWRGELDKAFQWLDRAVAQRDPGLTYLKTDPILRRLYGDPRWEELLRRLNLPTR